MKVERRTRSGRARGFAFAALALILAARPAGAQIEVTEATIDELQAAMAEGRTTSVDITRAYLARIAAYDQVGPALDAIVWFNPDALADAANLDEERARRGPRGPLHGIPVLVKENFDVRGLPTSAGSLALAGMIAVEDAFQIARLREAGAVIVGKTNMHELAGGITTRASLGGQTLNPYDLTRNPGGSSGGTAVGVTASFATLGWGTDACGSLRVPAAQNALVGLRPTKGLSSISGILPLSHTHDVAGPLARTVRDLAIALDATVGPDPADSATAIVNGVEMPSFVAALDAPPPPGTRLGILAEFFGDEADAAGVTRIVQEAIGRMVELGYDTVTVAIDGLEEGIEAAIVIGDEFKWDFMAYLRGNPNAPVGSLTELLERGLVDEELVEPLQAMNAPRRPSTPEYRGALTSRRVLRDAVVRAMDRAGVAALVYPTLRLPAAPLSEEQRGSNCRLSSTTGMPAISVPAGFTPSGLPIGMELLGRPLDDARLIGLAQAYERVGPVRRPPPHAPPLEDGAAPPPVDFGVQLRCEGCGAPDATVLRVDFVYDRVLGTLRYRIDPGGLDPTDVFSVVLRGPTGDGHFAVVRQMAGPGLHRREGSITLNASLRTRLEAGRLQVEVFTRTHPFGAGSAPVVVPGR